MRIAVISPHTEHNGNTTLSAMIALEMAKSNRKICLCHTKPISQDIFDYFSINAYADRTSTPSQIVKMIREGGVDVQNVSDYCKTVTENFEIFTNNSANFTQEDMEFMLKFIVNQFPHDTVIVDVDNINTEFNTEIISLCDVVVLNMSQSISDARAFKENRDEIIKMIGNKPLVTVINKYNSCKGTLQEMAKWMGIKKPNNWMILHENPYICWGTNHGKIADVIRLASKKDARVIELNAELGKIVAQLIKAKASTDKKKVRR